MTAPASYSTLVQELYVAYFGRPADETGLQNFEAALAAANAPTTMSGLLAAYSTNAAVASLVNAFGTSAESGRLYGTNIAGSAAAAQNFVTAVFESLFNRAPLPAGLAFWSNAITSGGVTPGDAALAIAANAGAADTAAVLNKVAGATAFTADLASHGEAGLSTYRGATEAGYGRAFLATINGTTPPATFDANAATTVDVMVNGGVPTQIPTPTPTPTPVSASNLTLIVAGDSVHLNGTTAASTVSLIGADLTAYPAATYGTVAGLATAAITTVTDTGGNFTLNASGNSNATTFNFSTGAVSGSDAASSAGITYSGVTTYVTSTHADTVTLSATTQNVTASSGGQTINLGNLVYTGALNLTAVASGTDTINATVDGNLAGAAISGTAGQAHIALVLSAAGTETLTTEQYNLITSTTAGSITFTGGTFGTDHITFSDAGTVTAIASVGNYNLANAGNTITLSNVGDFVTGDPNGGNDVVNLGSLAYTGTAAFGSGGTDSIHVVIGGNISGGNIASQGATVALVLSGAGSETLNSAEYNLFNASGIAGGTPGGNTITFSNLGTVTANANVYNYDLSTSGNTITLINAIDNVTGAASGNDIVNLAALTYTGAVAFGASGTDVIEVSGSSDISGGTITASGSTTVSLALGAGGTETMTVAQYNLFNATSITGGSPGADIIALSNGGTVTANANVDNYLLSTAGNTITLTNAGDNVTATGTGNDTVNLDALTYTGTLAFGAAGAADTINAAVSGNIGGGHITSTGATVALVLSAAGTETVSTEEYNTLRSIAFTGSAGAASNTLTFADTGTLTDNANVGNYNLAVSGGTTLNVSNNAADVVTSSAIGDTINIAAIAFTGTLNLMGPTGSDDIGVTGGTNISSGTINTVSATPILNFNNAGTVTMTTEQYNGFGAIVHSAGGTDAITFTDTGSGTIADNASVDTYNLDSSGGTTFGIDNNAAATVNSAAGGDTIDISVPSYTGTLSFTSGTDTIGVYGGVDIHLASVTPGGATLDLAFNSAGTVTMSTEQYNMFGSVSGGAASTNVLTFSDAGTLTASADVGNYHLFTGGGCTIALTDAADNVTDSGASGGDTFNLGALTYAGTITVGSGSNDTVIGTVSHDISGATINSSGVGVGLEVVGSGSESISSAEFSLFKATEINFSTGSGNTLYISPVVNSSLTLGDSDFANFSNTQNLQIGSTGSGVQSITLGTDFGAQLVTSVTTASSTGTITIDASATTTAASLSASSTGASGNIGITGGTGGDAISATIVAGSTINVTSNGTDTVTLNSGAGTASVIANGVDTIDLGAGHANGNDTVTLYQTAIGTQITNWLSNDTLNLSIANFTVANAIYGNAGTVSTIAAQTAHLENIVAFSAAQTSNVGDDLYDMGATTFANAAALTTYLDNPGNALTFASGTVPAGGASLLFEYEDGSGNAHLALAQLANGAIDTTATTAVDIAEFVGVPSTASLHNIHLV